MQAFRMQRDQQKWLASSLQLLLIVRAEHHTAKLKHLLEYVLPLTISMYCSLKYAMMSKDLG